MSSSINSTMIHFSWVRLNFNYKRLLSNFIILIKLYNPINSNDITPFYNWNDFNLFHLILILERVGAIVLLFSFIVKFFVFLLLFKLLIFMFLFLDDKMPKLGNYYKSGNMNGKRFLIKLVIKFLSLGLL